jgi:hypothetical protein
MSIRWHDRSALLLRHGVLRHLNEWWQEAMQAGEYQVALAIDEAMQEVAAAN